MLHTEICILSGCLCWVLGGQSVLSCLCLTADLEVVYVHDLLKIVGNSASNVQVLFLVTYLGLHSLASPVLAHSAFCLWLVSISDEGSLPEIALSGASKLASTLYFYYLLEVYLCYILRKTNKQLDVYSGHSGRTRSYQKYLKILLILGN